MLRRPSPGTGSARSTSSDTSWYGGLSKTGVPQAFPGAAMPTSWWVRLLTCSDSGPGQVSPTQSSMATSMGE